MPFKKGDPQTLAWQRAGVAKAIERRKQRRLKVEHLKGTKAQVVGSFLNDLREAWRSHGPGVLEAVAKRNPEKFLEVVASLVPKSDEVEHTHHGAISLDAQGLQELNRRTAVVLERAAARDIAHDPRDGEARPLPPPVMDLQPE